jgi:YbbR domain-containing protein
VALQVDRQIAVKTVPVRVTTSGQVAPGYWLSGLTVTPESVSITGGPAALGAVDYLDLPPLDLDGAKADVSRTTTLTAGTGYSIVGPSDVTVKATIAPLRTTEVLPLGIAVQGVGAGLLTHLSTPTVEVTLGGLVPALSALKPGDVSAVVDVSGLGPGPHTLPIRLSAPSSVTLDAARPATVTVTLEQPPAPTPSPQASSPSPSPSGPSVSSAPSSSPPAASPTASASPAAAPSPKPSS